jgi:hypothetical protein
MVFDFSLPSKNTFERMQNHVLVVVMVREKNGLAVDIKHQSDGVRIFVGDDFWSSNQRKFVRRKANADLDNASDIVKLGCHPGI